MVPIIGESLLGECGVMGFGGQLAHFPSSFPFRTTFPAPPPSGGGEGAFLYCTKASHWTYAWTCLPWTLKESGARFLFLNSPPLNSFRCRWTRFCHFLYQLRYFWRFSLSPRLTLLTGFLAHFFPLLRSTPLSLARNQNVHNRICNLRGGWLRCAKLRFAPDFCPNF